MKNVERAQWLADNAPEGADEPARVKQRPASPFETRLPRDLALTEQSVLQRLSPRRNRWSEIAAFDARVHDLEQRQAKLSEEMSRLDEQAQQAPSADTDRLAGMGARRPQRTTPRTRARPPRRADQAAPRRVRRPHSRH